MGRRLRTDRRLQELEAIYREHHRRVRWVLRSRGVGDEVLDDLVQEAFLAIHRRLPDRDRTIPLAMWVAGVTRNVAFSHRRSSARRLAVSRELPAPAEKLGPDEAVARRQAWEQLRQFLDGLDPDQREVFVLAEVLGMRVPEVARVVDAPLNTLYSRLRIARRRFKDRFGAEGDAQLRRAGHGERPTASERRHTWVAIAGRLPVVATSVGATSAATLGWALAGGLVVTVAASVGSLAEPSSEPSSESASEPSSERGGRATGVRSDSGARRSSVAAGGPEAPADAPVIAGPTVSASEPPDPPVLGQPSGPGRSMSPHSGSSVPSEASEEALDPGSSPDPHPAGSGAGTARRAARGDDARTGGPDSLVVTVEALRVAQRHVRQQRPREALAVLDDLGRAQPQGPMRLERLRLERDAACAAGEPRRAGSARDALAELGVAEVSEPACRKKTPRP